MKISIHFLMIIKILGLSNSPKNFKNLKSTSPAGSSVGRISSKERPTLKMSEMGVIDPCVVGSVFTGGLSVA